MATILQGRLSICLYVMAGIGIYLTWLVYKNHKTWDSISIYIFSVSFQILHTFFRKLSATSCKI